MPDVIITPASGIIEFKPSSSTTNKIEASGTTFNLVNTVSQSGTIFNIEGTNGSLFSVVDNLSGTLMSVNNNAGLPVLEVFSDDSVVAGRFGENDFVISSSGNVGIGKVPNNSYKLDVKGVLNLTNNVGDSNTQIYVDDVDGYLFIDPGSNREIQLLQNIYAPVDSIVLGIDGQISVSTTGVTIGQSATINLNVNGTATATSFSGAGTGLTGTASSLTVGAVTNGVYTTGNQSVGGVKTFTSQIINTTANNTANGGGQLYLNGTTGNRIDFNSNGVAAPAFTTRSAGTKIVLFPNIGASSADYGIGIESSTLWQSVPTTSQQFKWYAGTTNIATLTGQGRFTLTSNGDYVTPTLTLLADSTTDGSLKFFPMADGAGGYITFNSSANTTTNGVLIGGTSTMTGYHASRRQGAFQWIGGSTDATSRFEFLTANGGTTAQTMTSRMAITAEGRVGIGTSLPSHALQVVGAIVLDGSTIGEAIILDPNGYSFRMLDSSANNIVEFTESGTSFFEGGGGGGFYYDRSNNRVGIKTQSPSQPLHVAGNVLCDQSYMEKTSAPAISSGSLTLNLNNGSIFLVSLNAAITSITISNVPSTSNTSVAFSIVFTADGTARSVTWPASVKWPAGSAPTLTSTNTKKDILSFVSTDQGSTWFGFVGGQNY